jgi:hypothetical protein
MSNVNEQQSNLSNEQFGATVTFERDDTLPNE